MRWSQTFIPTMKEVPSEAESPGHRLLIRAGFIRRLSAGLYSYLPMGLRVIRKIENIIRQEMEQAGACELLMPILQPRELWERSGRWDSKELSMLTVKNRTNQEFVLAPTHEEVITDLAAREIKSYKDLPRNFFQIQAKFRDELRPRFGLIRAKEFIMKDGYSFDEDPEKSLETYRKMEQAYEKIFSRCGLSIEKVQADPGAMGGGLTHEFMALAEIGEDTIIKCEKCRYASNIESAEAGGEEKTPDEALQELKTVVTPGIKTVAQLIEFLKLPPKKLIKTLIYEIDSETAAVILPGDREINEIKLKRNLKALEIKLAGEEKIKQLTGAPRGFSGPLGLKNVKIIADTAVMQIRNAVAGANTADKHILNVNPGRDFAPDEIYDITLARENDPCPECGSALKIKKGIEVGQVFNLGTKYSTTLNARFLDSDGTEKPCVMGCYGIGVSRTASAVVEQNHDENGIIWPEEIAPFKVLVLPVNINDEKINETARKIYFELLSRGVDVLLDDRDVRAGVKFKDADLTGIPVRITAGKKSAEGIVELYDRKTRKTEEITVEKAAGYEFQV